MRSGNTLSSLVESYKHGEARQNGAVAVEARVFPSVVALQETIHCFVAAHNRDPKLFVWKADPRAIIAAAQRGYQALDSIH